MNALNSSGWTITRRITVGLGALLLVLAMISVFAVVRLASLRGEIVTMAESTLPTVLALSDMAVQAEGEHINRLSAVDADETTAQGLIADSARREASIVENLKKYETNLNSEADDRRLLDEIRSTHETLAKTQEQINALDNQSSLGEWEALLEQQRLIREVQYPSYARFQHAIQAALEYHNRIAQAAALASQEAARMTMWLLGVTSLLAVLVSATLAWFTLRTIRSGLGAILVDLNRGSMHTASAALQMMTASQTLSSGASEQAAAIEETSASLEQMSAMIRSTADNSQKAMVLASDARSLAGTGVNTMDAMVAAMADIGVASSDVAKIVKNIDEIAFQTNILALNAAVEAARAGEAGAGFAVVADEVRSLAQRSAAAARETAQKIDVAMASAQRGSARSEQVARALNDISDKVVATDLLVAEIAKAASEQALGVTQVNLALGQMDRIAQSNSSGAEQSFSRAEELNSHAENLTRAVEKLEGLVGRFEDDEEMQSEPMARAVPSHSATGSFRARDPQRLSQLPTHTLDRIPMPEVRSLRDEDKDFRSF